MHTYECHTRRRALLCSECFVSVRHNTHTGACRSAIICAIVCVHTRVRPAASLCVQTTDTSIHIAFARAPHTHTQREGMVKSGTPRTVPARRATHCALEAAAVEPAAVVAANIYRRQDAQTPRACVHTLAGRRHTSLSSLSSS